MNGFLNLLKPPGMTSHDVVQEARRLLRMRRLGHTGTLDPAAAGVLVLTVGYATRLGQYLLDCTKAYRAEIVLGASTDTADAEGRVVARADSSGVPRVAVQKVLATLTGAVCMRPPRHSAVRVGGKHLYELARAGQQVEAPTREVQIHLLRLVEFVPGAGGRLLVEVECSKGTYIRSLAEMIGERLGCGAYLAALLRTRVGPHALADSLALEQLADQPRSHLIPPAAGLPHLPALPVDDEQRRRLVHGNAIALEETNQPPGRVVVVDGEGVMVCVAEIKPGEPALLQPKQVVAGTD